MRYLVAGGAGFIGSNLCRALLTRGDEVLCVDNYITGKKQNLFEYLNNPLFEAVRHDVTRPFEAEVDKIINLACPASPVHYQRDPVQTVKTNVLGTINLLDLAVKLSAPIFHASTSEVYGDPHVHPQRESYWGNVNPIGPRACYDEGKRCAETLCFDYFRQHKVDVKVARIFNTYGPGMSVNDGRVVSNFIVQALLGENITIYGDGEQTRSFCYVDDLVQFILSFCDLSNHVVHPINVGNPIEYSMRDLAEIILSLIGGKSKIEFLPLPEDDPRQRKPDISKAKSIFGWTPRVELHDGLRETIDYFKFEIYKK